MSRVFPGSAKQPLLKAFATSPPAGEAQQAGSLPHALLPVVPWATEVCQWGSLCCQRPFGSGNHAPGDDASSRGCLWPEEGGSGGIWLVLVEPIWRGLWCACGSMARSGLSPDAESLYGAAYGRILRPYSLLGKLTGSIAKICIMY
jgi:hypothetical protein